MGKRPCLTLPLRSLVVVRSEMRITRCAIETPSAVLSTRRGCDLLPFDARRVRLRYEEIKDADQRGFLRGELVSAFHFWSSFRTSV
jgi:hypothetical protein